MRAIQPLARPLFWVLMWITLATSAPAFAQVKLLMFERDGCPWCARWNAEIGPIYPKTDEGKAAPLERINIYGTHPIGLQLRGWPEFTPTFVLVLDGKEISRIEGYPGEDFFWGLLGKMLEKLPENGKGDGT